MKKNGLGEVLCAPLDVELDEANVYQPDIFFISNTNSSIIKDPKIIGAPDLIVEILSGNKYHDLNTKRYFMKYSELKNSGLRILKRNR